jgi:hypothetical protein
MYEVWAHLQLRLKRLNVMKCIVCKNQCLVEHAFQLVEGAVCPYCQVAVNAYSFARQYVEISHEESAKADECEAPNLSTSQTDSAP